MSGMYGMLFGRQPAANLILGLLLEVAKTEFGRDRDAWVEVAGDWIELRVHTRNGGGNRGDQAAAIESMRKHPWYVRDADMEFDTTYADFYFAPPLDFAPLDFTAIGAAQGVDMNALTAYLLRSAVPPVDMRARWTEAIANIGKNTGTTSTTDKGKAGD